MSFTVLTKIYSEPPFCEREILRYAGCKATDNSIIDLLNSCIDETKGKLTYKVCYCISPFSVSDGVCDFHVFKTKSEDIASHLSKCNRAVLFASTVGVEIDRLIAKYSLISPAKALMFQAIGTERIEALCDAFCADLQKQFNTVQRYSPGYGDLPLDMQKDFFNLLDCGKRIGLFLNDSLLMSPSKSVTAIVGISDESESADDSRINKLCKNKCSACGKEFCTFRRDE